MLSVSSLEMGLLEGLPDALVVADAELRIVRVNRQAELLFGSPRSELIGRPLEVLLPLRDRADHERSGDAYLPGAVERLGTAIGDGLPYAVQRQDGTEVDVATTVTSISSDGQTYYLATLRAVPSPLTGASALGIGGDVESARQLKIALRRSPIVIGTVDRDLRYTWVYNPEPHFPLERAIGKRDDELNSGRGVRELMDFKRRVFETGESDQQAFEFDLGDEIRSYDIIATPITNDQGEVTEVNTVAIDVSHLRSLMRFQRDFVAMIAHDLKQPITVAQIWAQRLIRSKGYDEDAMQDIMEQMGRLNRMVEDLLDTAVIESGRLELRPEPCDLLGVIEESVRRARQTTERHQFRVVSTGESVRGVWDPERLGRVMDNLLGNAIKYSPRGGEILISVRTTDDWATVAVTDHGTGIPSEELAVVFECFGRTSGARHSGIGGLGLGLCIARGIIEGHGGHITASSDGLGRGSTLEFTMPLKAPVIVH